MSPRRPRQLDRIARTAGIPLGVLLMLGISMSGTHAAGPAAPIPPASPIALPTGPLFPDPSLDPLEVRSGRGGPVAPPADIVGSWYDGTGSSIGYVDPGSGSFTDGGSQGIGYAFRPDGSWQFGYLMTSALYGCQMRVLVFNQGELAAADPATHLLQLHTDRSQMHSEDTCSVADNYDKELPPSDEVLIWERTTDEYGDVLFLRHPDSGPSPFRPMDW